MTRKLLLSALLLTVASVCVAALYFAFRNKAADKLAPVLMLRATGLPKERADRLERELGFDQNNFADRIELLYFYNFKRISAELTPEELANRRRHILWVIANEPSSAFAGGFAAEFEPQGEDPDTEGAQAAKMLWLQQAQSGHSNSHVLYNAGKFFASMHEFPQSEEFLQQSLALDPNSYDAAEELATDYWHDARYSPTNDQLKASAAKALTLFEQALQNARNNDQREFVLPYAAQAAFEAGDSAKAAAWSREMLSMAEKPEQIRDHSDEVHYGNIVLGRIALRQGDTVSAAADLVKAARVDGNPHLDTFGPNMMLAKELIEKGDDRPVIEYLEACGKFWKDDDGKLAKWQAEAGAGKMPDFGANLRY